MLIISMQVQKNDAGCYLPHSCIFSIVQGSCEGELGLWLQLKTRHRTRVNWHKVVKHEAIELNVQCHRSLSFVRTKSNLKFMRL